MGPSSQVEHTHLLCDLWFKECEILKYVPPLRAATIEAARAGGAHVVHSHFHQFSPWGVTGFLLLQESHISLHTWVEERYAALDVYGCGSIDHTAIVGVLVDRLRPEQVALLDTRRGGSRTQIAIQSRFPEMFADRAQVISSTSAHAGIGWPD